MPLPIRSCAIVTILSCALFQQSACANSVVDSEMKFDAVVLSQGSAKPVNSNAAINRGGIIQLQKAGKAAIQLTPKALLPEGDFSLQFEAFCLGKVTSIKLKAKRKNGESVSLSLPRIDHSEVFVTYTADLYTDLAAATDVQLHLNLSAGSSLQIKSVRLVPRSKGSALAIPSTTAETIQLSRYLDQIFPAQITSVQAKKDTMVVKGKVPEGSASISFVEVSMATLLSDTSSVLSESPVEVKSDGSFNVEFARYDAAGKDKALSKWRLLSNDEPMAKPISHFRYAENLHCVRPNLPPAKVTSKKGLGGWHLSKSPKTKNDLVELGIAAVTININAMHDLVSPTPRSGWPKFRWQGQTYYANPNRLRSIDQKLLEAKKHDQMVSVILLVTNPKQKASDNAKLLANPEADPRGIFAMPNVTSETSLRYYGAILKLMAERWTRPDGRYGRIHHWIMHNEVDFGWIWTNAGRKSDVQFMSLYYRSMRLADLIVRQYDPNARVWISLTHHWASTGTSDGYSSKRILELLLKYCKAEGDFPWALAYHPYPENLRDPRTWKDKQATFDFDTLKITPKNLEVLDAWMKRPEMKYQGEVRPVHLSENGFNSPDYSPASLRDQAAGMALAWKKMERLSSIKMWHYHNWVDNRNEGGLRIGLRKFPDDETNPYAAKPIWHLYKALGTGRQASLIRPHLKTIGISSWDDLLHRDPIE